MAHERRAQDQPARSGRHAAPGRSQRGRSSDAPNERSAQPALRLATLALALAQHGEAGMTRQELLALPQLHSFYGATSSAAEQALRRDLIELTGLPFREQQRLSAGAEVDFAERGRPRALARYDPATRRYHLLQPMGPLRLSGEALDAFCLLAQTLDHGRTLPGGQDLFRGIRAALPEEQRAKVEAALRGDGPARRRITLDLGVAHLDEAAHATLQQLQRAMRERQTIAFAYQPRGLHAPAKEHSGDEVLEIRMDSSHYYVVVWCEQAQRDLDLRLDRIVPGSLRLYPLMARGRRRRGERVRYRLSAEVARGEVTKRMEEQAEEWQPDGSVIVSGRARSPFWARQLLLKYGAGAHALEPPALVEALHREAERMATIYARPEVTDAAGRENNPQSDDT